jgi:nitroimidazol reductase NimA-like FMN-containing flavoprotein (pyridoxamine 5'-phosphate oxidase superfamily)
VNDGERDAFLREDNPPWVAAIATLDESGAPHVVSVWYRWDGQVFHLWSTAELRWPNNLLRDPRASLVVFEHDHPLRAVYAKGMAKVRTGSVEELIDHIRPIVSRYEADPEATIASYAGPDQVAVTIVPTSLVGKVNG